MVVLWFITVQEATVDCPAIIVVEFALAFSILRSGSIVTMNEIVPPAEETEEMSNPPGEPSLRNGLGLVPPLIDVLPEFTEYDADNGNPFSVNVPSGL